MKEKIPLEKTKAYWENQVPDMYKQKEKILFKKGLRNCCLATIFGLGISSLIYITESPFFSLILALCGISLLIFFLVLYLVHFFRPRRKIRKNGGVDSLVAQEVIFYETEGTWETANSETLPHEHPVNKLFPEDITVFEFDLDYKLPDQNIRWFPIRRVYCIGTPEKRELIEKLIHMKEGVALRHESRRFKVTYKKYSKELVRIDLCEDEEYPAHCHYEELVERINIMF